MLWPVTSVHQCNNKGVVLELDATLSHVFGTAGEPRLINSDGGICFAALDEYVGRRAEDLQLRAFPETPQDEGHVDYSRVGPVPTRLDKASLFGELRIAGSSAESWASFGSARATTAVTCGKWMYEALLGTSGIMQIGFVTIAGQFTSEEGVGDWPDSYAFDGRRVRKWSVTSAARGPAQCLYFHRRFVLTVYLCKDVHRFGRAWFSARPWVLRSTRVEEVA